MHSYILIHYGANQIIQQLSVGQTFGDIIGTIKIMTQVPKINSVQCILRGFFQRKKADWTTNKLWIFKCSLVLSQQKNGLKYVVHTDKRTTSLLSNTLVMSANTKKSALNPQKKKKQPKKNPVYSQLDLSRCFDHSSKRNVVYCISAIFKYHWDLWGC